MARGDTENAFQAAAGDDGIVLVRARVPWLNQRGHLGLPAETQAAKRLVALPGDFLHLESMTFIEVDEHQHFTTARLSSLDLYPADARLGFDLGEYRALCREWSPRADRYRAAKSAIGFGPAGRQAQRAYYDSLRDLAVPAWGCPPVVRVAAPERDGLAAYRRVRARLAHLRS